MATHDTLLNTTEEVDKLVNQEREGDLAPAQYGARYPLNTSFWNLKAEAFGRRQVSVRRVWAPPRERQSILDLGPGLRVALALFTFRPLAARHVCLSRGEEAAREVSSAHVGRTGLPPTSRTQNHWTHLFTPATLQTLLGMFVFHLSLST